MIHVDLYCPVCDRVDDSRINTFWLVMARNHQETIAPTATHFKSTCEKCGTSYEWDKGDNSVVITPKGHGNA